MAYNIVDLLDKAIAIAEKRKKIYEQIEFEDNKYKNFNIIVKVMVKNINQDIKNYNLLKEQVTYEHEEIIDFVTYDKISFLFNEFQVYLMKPDVKDPTSFIRFSLEMEKRIYALFIDIQGRIVKNTKDTKTEIYKTIERMLEFKQKRIADLIKLLQV